MKKKFLVNTLPENLDPGIDICQGYLVNTPEKVVRVRIKGDKVSDHQRQTRRAGAAGI